MLDIALFIYCVLEFTHYQKQCRVYNYFNKLYVEPNNNELTSCIDALLAADKDFFDRAQVSSISSHLTNREQLCDALTFTKEELAPPDKWKAGRSKLYWSYTPFLLDTLMKQARVLGEQYMLWKGYTRKTYLTNDGYYNVFTYHTTASTKRPLIFFPGLGFGAIPYVHVAKLFNRTVHLIEVPNFCYATPNTNSHATARGLKRIVKQCVGDQEHDVAGHSFGSFHASIYLNASYTVQKIRNVFICEGFTNPVDILVNHTIPFVNRTHFGKLPVIRYSFGRFVIFLKLFANNIYIHSFCKRIIHPINTNWRDYGNIQIKYIYSENDELIDCKYTMRKTNPDNCYCIPNGKHGTCFFGKRRNELIATLF